MKRGLILLFCIGWLLGVIKHFWVLPIIGDDHDISGFEFRIRW